MQIPKALSSLKEMWDRKSFSPNKDIKAQLDSINESELSMPSIALDDGSYFIQYNGTQECLDTKVSLYKPWL